MKRKSTRLAVLSFALLYLLGAFCFSVAAPGMSIASSFADCSNMNSAQGMFPCDHPTFACRPATADHSAILSSAQSRDPSSAVPRTVVTMAVISPPDAGVSGLAKSRRHIPFGPSQKIPIHILNSVLIL